MLKPRAVALRSLVLSALLAFALPAAAQTPCPGVCIGFAAAGGVAAVPLSPAAMLLLSLFVAGAGYVAMRRRSGLMAFVLATALAGAAMTTDIREAIAASLYQVVLGAGNMASVTVPASYVGPVDVQNSNGSAATVTSLTVGSGFALVDAATTLHVGSVVPAGGTLTGAVVVEALPTGPALSDVALGDNFGNSIGFDLGALVGLPLGSTVGSISGFPLVDDFGIQTYFQCDAFGACTVAYDVGNPVNLNSPRNNIGFTVSFSILVKVIVPGYIPTLDRPMNIQISNQ